MAKINSADFGLVLSSPASIWSGTEKITDIVIPGNGGSKIYSVRVVDMIGVDRMVPDGIPDIVVRVVNAGGDFFLHLYANGNGKKPANYVYPGIGWESATNYFTKYYEYN